MNESALPTNQPCDPTEAPVSSGKTQYPPWIGQKFKSDGSVLPFLGNTIVSHLSLGCELYRHLSALYDKLQQQDFISAYVLLPQSSWHMTVFEGVCDTIRENGLWPSDLPLDASLEECTSCFEHKLKGKHFGLRTPLRMIVQGWEPFEDVIALRVMPASLNEATALNRLRNALSEHLKIRHAGHEQYVFHISLAYTLRHLSQEEIEVVSDFLNSQLKGLPDAFELGDPEFCTFDNMFGFQRLFYLR